MQWINVKEKLPKSFEIVLITDNESYFVGYRQNCDDLNVWWASNPNEKYLGHQSFTVSIKPTHWCYIVQPERLNPKTPKGDAIV